MMRIVPLHASVLTRIRLIGLLRYLQTCFTMISLLSGATEGMVSVLPVSGSLRGHRDVDNHLQDLMKRSECISSPPPHSEASSRDRRGVSFPQALPSRSLLPFVSCSSLL